MLVSVVGEQVISARLLASLLSFEPERFYFLSSLDFISWMQSRALGVERMVVSMNITVASQDQTNGSVCTPCTYLQVSSGSLVT